MEPSTEHFLEPEEEIEEAEIEALLLRIEQSTDGAEIARLWKELDKWRETDYYYDVLGEWIMENEYLLHYANQEHVGVTERLHESSGDDVPTEF